MRVQKVPLNNTHYHTLDMEDGVRATQRNKPYGVHNTTKETKRKAVGENPANNTRI